MPAAPCQSHGRRLALGATLVLLLAAALRLWALERLPGGLHFDLAAYLFDAVEVIDGARPVFFPRNTGREPFVIYLYALVGAGLGPTPFTARLVTDAFGMLSVAAVGFAARQALALARPGDRSRGDATALLAAGVMAALYWSVHFSRFGLRTGALPALLALAFGFLLRGLRGSLVADSARAAPPPSPLPVGEGQACPERSRRGEGATARGGMRFFLLASPATPSPPPSPTGRGSNGARTWLLPTALAGLFLGLGLESYTAARLAPLAAALPLLIALVVERQARWLGRLVVVVLVAGLVFAPLGLYFLQHPADFGGHSYDNSVLNPAVNGGNTALAVVRGLVATAAGYILLGSPGAAENLPGRPMFDPIGALALLVGLAVVAAWLRGPLPRVLAAVTLLGWLGALSLTSILSLPTPGFVRLSGAVPAAAVVAGIGALAIVEWARQLPLWQGLGIERRMLPGVLVGGGLITLSAGWTARDYFGVWANQYAYRGAMVDKFDAATFLLGFPAGTRLFLAPLWADDFGVQFLTRARPLETVQVGLGAVIPTDPSHLAVYAYPYEDTTGPEELRALLPGQPPVELVRDASGRYDLLRIVRYKPTAALAPVRPQRLEDGVAFGGSEIRLPSANASSITVTLRWFAEARPSRDYTVFVQLRDDRGTAAQHDGRPVGGLEPTTGWHPGDLVLDRHELKAPPDLGGRRYRLYAGVYDPATGKRLKLLDANGNSAPVDELLLGSF